MGVRVRLASVAAVAALVVIGTTGVGAAAGDFVNFESGEVHPLALSPDHAHLYAVNTPDGRLEVLAIATDGTLTRDGDVEVGLEPVAVAARTNTEVWVVNHLSDSVSVVDTTDPAHPVVTATLLVGDEPEDVVFAGSAHTLAFVTAAHRGQNLPGDPQLTTPGIGRADVWVFDATDLAAAPTIVTLFSDAPRALAASPDGSRVYVAAFHSGNQTTAVNEQLVNTSNGGLGLPPPNPPNTTGQPAPSTGLIVKFKSGKWVDELGRDWTFRVPFTLPDKDVFVIDATATPPVELASAAVTGVGTTLFNMAVNPVDGAVYVSNTDARNQVRFVPNLRGHIAESRITIINGGVAQAVPLNPFINYGVDPGPLSEINRSLAFPVDMTFSSDGTTLYVAAFGSGEVGVLDANANVLARIKVGGGPSGLALVDELQRLYVLDRFDDTISVVDTGRRRELGRVPLRFDPSPPVVKDGRPFLYDAHKSGHGDSACASCHIFGDFDGLAWDLGDPTGQVLPNPNPFVIGSPTAFHPMKGPMTTQSLRGLNGAGSMHWRGDRNGGALDPLNEVASFEEFNPDVVHLLGAGAELSAADMAAFTNFALTIAYPPNPIENLDRSLTAAQQAGKTFFTTVEVDEGVLQCQNCHTLPLGTAGKSSFDAEPQDFKVPHLRNLYEKVGMFSTTGPQVRGFGFLHDGSIASVFNFLQNPVFNFGTDQTTADTNRRNVEAFVLAFDTGLAPIVGQQITADATNFTDTAVTNRIALLTARADAGDCDVIAKGVLNGERRGWLYVGSGAFRSDRISEPAITAANLLAQAATPGQELTYTAVPPGTGMRLGIDRDRDGVLDRDELDAGNDPADPSDAGACQTLTVKAATFRSLTAAAGQQSLSLKGNFPGVFTGMPDDVVRVTVGTNLGPLVNATLDNGRGFRGRGGGASYFDRPGVNQHVTRAALHTVRGPAVRFTLHLAKAPLTTIASASSLDVAVHVYSPSTGVTTCAQVTGVPCQLNATGTVLSCSD